MDETITMDELNNFFPWVVFTQVTNDDGTTTTTEQSGATEDGVLGFAQMCALDYQKPAIIYRVNSRGEREVLWKWDGKPETYDGVRPDNSLFEELTSPEGDCQTPEDRYEVWIQGSLLIVTDNHVKRPNGQNAFTIQLGEDAETCPKHWLKVVKELLAWVHEPHEPGTQ